MSGAVLIIGSRRDPHVEAVTAALAGSRTEVVVLDPWTAQSRASSLSIGFGEHVAGSVREGNVSIELLDIASVWWRLKPPLGTAIDKQEPDARDFAIREWAHQLDYLDSALRVATWVNPRPQTRTWSVKPYQLAAARAHGFAVPRTLVSNDAAEINAFSGAVQGSLIFKPLTWYADHSANVLYTNELTPERIKSSAAQLAICPGIFQERVPKKHELRITCVGRQVFTARIHSQHQQGAALDWRRCQFDVPCEVVAGDNSLERAVLSFHERTGLVFGAYDFIVTPEDDLVFLEVNPSGQWLWLEERTHQPITAAVVDALRKMAPQATTKGPSDGDGATTSVT